ncbi:MAG: MBL fold metallo-hydrolase, partial [Lachnoclostridium sp.]|nr:MBL fold metallo-hydrolase [Lachnoclostridium sp.]
YGKNANNASVGIVLSHGNNQFIFTGDAEEESEYNMLRSNENIGADVYKVSHHGSKSATSIEFLDRVNPQYAVISCGDDNSYGHPHEQTLDRLHSKNISLFRTDEQGDIIASSDGTDITWNCQPSDLWTAGEGNRSDNESITQTTEQDQPNIIPADTTYVINTNTRKFHAPTCSSIKDMSAQNRLNSTQTREEIINQDYSPCGRCHP